MKKLIFIALTALLISCNNDPRNKLAATGNFGTQVNEKEAITVNDALTKLKGEGCWLTLENQGGEPLFVEVENKAFVLPHHINGKVAVVTGKVSQTTNDAGKIEPMITTSGILIK